MALICPICSVATAYAPADSEQKALNVSTSRPGTNRYSQVVAHAVVNMGHDADWYAICRCQNCERLFIASKEYYSDDWQSVWPLPPTLAVREGIPENVRLAFEEAHTCLAVNAYGGCLLMCRTTIERLQRDRKVSGLKELMEKGEISSMLYGQADEVRYWANMVAHDDFDQKALAPEALVELIAYIEALLNAVYVEPARLAALKSARAEATSEEDEPD